MSSNAALIAVLSVVGYLVLKHFCFRTSFRWDALEWQQNVFESSALGLILFGASRIAAVWLQTQTCVDFSFAAPAVTFFGASFPVPYSGSVVGALLIGLALSGLANLAWPKTRATELAIANHGGRLRVLLLDAQLGNRAVILTLASRKVYVGFVFETPTLHKPAYVVLFPTLSGYRRNEDHSIQWTTNYAPAYLDLIARKEKGETLQTELDHFQLVLPLDTVSSATYFDVDIYEQHFGSIGGAGGAPRTPRKPDVGEGN